MFDIPLRPLKDILLHPLLPYVPQSVHPHHITLLALFSGLTSCLLTTLPILPNSRILSLFFWFLNRLLDCLDGAFARHRNITSELGGFLDLLCDFVVYALIPVCVVVGNYGSQRQGDGGGGGGGGGGGAGGGGTCEGMVRDALIVAALEGSFYINNFVLFYIAALVEKADAKIKATSNTSTTTSGETSGVEGGKRLQRHKDEITGVAMRPALVEGFESGVFFTLMLALPEYIGVLAGVMLVGVVVGTGQRVKWLVETLGREKVE